VNAARATVAVFDRIEQILTGGDGGGQ